MGRFRLRLNMGRFRLRLNMGRFRLRLNMGRFRLRLKLGRFRRERIKCLIFDSEMCTLQKVGGEDSKGRIVL